MTIRRPVAVVLLAGVLASAVACDNGKDGAQGTPTSQASTTTRVSTSVETSTTGAATAPAYQQLEPFITAAKAFDAQLKVAAKAINRTGPRWPTAEPAVTAAVKAADPDLLDAALPAGLPPALLQKTVVVYSELVSRRMAMNDFAFPEQRPPEFAAQQQEEWRRALTNGHESARRFPADLATLERAARTAPPFAAQPPTSRAQAELLLVLELIGMAEGCSDNRGGVIFDKVPVVEWSAGESFGRPRDGFIDGGPFTANLVDGRWQLNINAC